MGDKNSDAVPFTNLVPERDTFFISEHPDKTKLVQNELNALSESEIRERYRSLLQDVGASFRWCLRQRQELGDASYECAAGWIAHLWISHWAQPIREDDGTPLAP